MPCGVEDAAHSQASRMSARVWVPTVRIRSRECYGMENETQDVLGVQYSFTKSIIQHAVSDVLRRRTLSRSRPPGKNLLEGTQGCMRPALQQSPLLWIVGKCLITQMQKRVRTVNVAGLARAWNPGLLAEGMATWLGGVERTGHLKKFRQERCAITDENNTLSLYHHHGDKQHKAAHWQQLPSARPASC